MSYRETFFIRAFPYGSGFAGVPSLLCFTLQGSRRSLRSLCSLCKVAHIFGQHRCARSLPIPNAYRPTFQRIPLPNPRRETRRLTMIFRRHLSAASRCQSAGIRRITRQFHHTLHGKWFVPHYLLLRFWGIDSCYLFAQDDSASLRHRIITHAINKFPQTLVCSKLLIAPRRYTV